MAPNDVIELVWERRSPEDLARRSLRPARHRPMTASAPTTTITSANGSSTLRDSSMGHGSWTSRAVGRGAPPLAGRGRTPPAASSALDFSPEMVLAARASLGDRVEVQVMDAEQLDFDGTGRSMPCCARSVCSSSLRRSERWRRCIACSCPGGTVALSSWTQADERWAWGRAPLLRDLSVNSRPSSSRIRQRRTTSRSCSRLAGFRQRPHFRGTRRHHLRRRSRMVGVEVVLRRAGSARAIRRHGPRCVPQTASAAMQPLREESGFPMRLAALFALADKG